MTKYWPAQIDEIENRRSLICEPLPPENVISLRKTRSLHAVLCEALIDTQALLARLEAGVQVQQPHIDPQKPDSRWRWVHIMILAGYASGSIATYYEKLLAK
jgi:hypothetical protein